MYRRGALSSAASVKMSIWRLLFTTVLFITTIQGSWLPPTIQVTMLVHPYNKAAFLTYSLGAIEEQDYPKDRIRIRIITERIFFDEAQDVGSGFGFDAERRSLMLDERIRQNDLTIEMLKRWTKQNRDLYNEVELSITNIKLSESLDGNYWTKDRFKFVINTKNQELDNAIRSWADFLLFIDADVILTNRFAFRNHTHLERIKDLVIVSPLLRSFSTYANFWAGMDEKGYYLRTDDYLPILKRTQTGTFSVPMVHSCVFLDLRKSSSRALTFDPAEVDFLLKNTKTGDLTSTIPFDDIIAFAKSATLNGVKLYINNVHNWGLVPPPMTEDSLQDPTQLLVDLELESLIEGPGFPVSPVLESYVDLPETVDSLGVDKIYVINLARRVDRKKRMAKSLQVLGIKASIWNATDGKLLDEDYLRKYDIRLLEGYVDPYHKRPITFGEIGCFMSHYRIWEDAFRNNYSKIIILEDDVRFDQNFRHQWSEALERFEQLSEFDFLYLGRKLNGDHDDEVVVDSHFVRPGYSYWTIGYLITKDGIRKLLQSNPLSRMIPVDEYLPIMYGSHVNHTLAQLFDRIEPLNALSLRHLLISPTHYVGDSAYISDTEDSDKIDSDKNRAPSEEVIDNLEPTTISFGLQPPPSNPLKHIEF